MRQGLSYGARGLPFALLLAAGFAVPAAARGERPFRHHWDDERQEWLEPEPPLPEGILGTVRPVDGESVRRINTIREVFEAIQACWQPPSGSGYSGQEITLRLSFKRNGEVIGTPRITFYNQGTQAELREAFARSVREAFERCTPLPFTESFGAAIAGRIFAIRFNDTRPM